MANKRIAIICGHGNGDPGAIGNGYQEADMARKIGDTLFEKMKSQTEVYMYDQAKNFYTAKEWAKFTTNDEVVEIHLNAHSSVSAEGAEVLIKEGYAADGLDNALMEVLTKYFANRKIKTRSDLGNMNGFAARKISYRLIEVCFITNSDDMKILTSQFDKIMTDMANAILKAVGSSGTAATDSTAGYTKITGTAQATVDQMASYIKSVNAAVPQSVLNMIPHYFSEGKTEGIRGDIAFAQSCLETGNFKFEGSAVDLSQNNFCGLGVTSNGVKGNSFNTPQLGIRAQVQHLKAYANKEALVNACIDPRFTYVTRGCAPYVEYLGIQENPEGKGWAAGVGYGEKVLSILKKIMGMSAGSSGSENKIGSDSSSGSSAGNKSTTTGSATIKQIQKTLNSRYSAGLVEDGIYGPKTKTALIKGLQTELNTQFKAGIVVDGIWGPKTKAACVTVQKNAKGNLTFILQAALICQGYSVGSTGADGKFGANTESAVKKYQKAKGLSQDGIAGPKTFTALLQ